MAPLRKRNNKWQAQVRRTGDTPRDGYSPPCSNTMRTARVRTSGESVFVVLLTRFYPDGEFEPPTVPVRFISMRFPDVNKREQC